MQTTLRCTMRWPARFAQAHRRVVLIVAPLIVFFALVSLWVLPPPTGVNDSIGFAFAFVFLVAILAAALLILAAAFATRLADNRMTRMHPRLGTLGWILVGAALILLSIASQDAQNQFWPLIFSFAAWIYFLLVVPTLLIVWLVRLLRRRGRASTQET